jgi:hypothetical protein
MSLRSVFANGKRYPVTEHKGYLSAHLFDKRGWTSVWGQDFVELVRRIRFVLEN